MMTPKQFAEYLKNSTLSKEDQEGLLSVIQYLSPEQITAIGESLKKDNETQQKYFRQAKLKLDMVAEAAKKEIAILKEKNQK